MTKTNSKKGTLSSTVLNLICCVDNVKADCTYTRCYEE